MPDDAEPAIPFGIEVQTDEDRTIEEADRNRRYVCPKCRELLDQRVGGIRRPYFAHHPSSEKRSCPWYSGEGIRQELEARARESIDAAQRIRLFIQVEERPGGLRDALLFGSVPPISNQDLLRLTIGTVPIKGEVTSVGTLNKVELPGSFLPEDTNGGWIPLETDASEYLLGIRPIDLSNGGDWRARRLSFGDCFLGDRTIAERILDPRFISIGSHLFKLVKKGDVPSVSGAERYRLGKFELIHVAVAAETTELVRQLVPGATVDAAPFHVDIVHPFEAAPRVGPRDKIAFHPEDDFLLALVPPPEKDPILNVYVIPYRSNSKLSLDAAGRGVPRYVRVKIKNSNPFRLLVQWPYFTERDVLLDFAPESDKRHSADRRIEVDCFLNVSSNGQSIRLDPLSHDRYEFVGEYSSGGAVLLPKMELVAPTGMEVSLVGEFPSDRGAPVLRSGGVADASTLGSSLISMFETGARDVSIDFGMLGRVSLLCNRFFEEMVRRQAEAQEAAEAALVQRRTLLQRHQRRKHKLDLANELDALLPTLGRPIPRGIPEAFIDSLPVKLRETGREDVIVIRGLIRRWRKEGSALGNMREDPT